MNTYFNYSVTTKSVTLKSDSSSLSLASKNWVHWGIYVGSITTHGNKSTIPSISNWVVVPVSWGVKSSSSDSSSLFNSISSDKLLYWSSLLTVTIFTKSLI